ncbi:MAG: TetR/AcrR family transcriptional regulator [Elusimicrobia bacterium]|nr:TetR/AcrR family transcriptional regulator [Elusimicrobiota bacterium]
MKRANSGKSDIVGDEILLAAKNLFRTYGLDRTTMESIAEAAGKSKGTLYYYFKSKEDVFYAIASAERKKAQQELESAVNSCASATERLRTFFQAREDIINTKRKLYPVIFKEQKKHIELFYKLRRENSVQEINLLKRILLEGAGSGEFKRIKKSDCDIIARAEIDSRQGRFLNLILDGKDPVRNHTVDIMIDILIRGIS